MTNKITLILFLTMVFIGSLKAQNPPTIEIILTESGKQTTNYREAFKNLLAIETKTFEQFGKNGEVKEKKTVESNFLVYQSSKDAKVSSELRSVTKVDGKPVSDSVERSNRFFAELAKATTLKSELEKIQKEGNRYDKTIEVIGLTLYEAVILSDNLRPFFDFKLLSSENYQGNDVFVIGYTQTKKSPFISFNEDNKNSKDLTLNFELDLPKSLRKTDAFLNGKLWIDAKTYQIRREERILTIQTANPINIMESTFEYQPSNFEIFVTKQISVLVNKLKEKDKKYIVTKETKVSFDYSEFKKSETDVKIIDDTVKQ